MKNDSGLRVVIKKNSDNRLSNLNSNVAKNPPWYGHYPLFCVTGMKQKKFELLLIELDLKLTFQRAECYGTNLKFAHKQ